MRYEIKNSRTRAVGPFEQKTLGYCVKVQILFQYVL